MFGCNCCVSRAPSNKIGDHERTWDSNEEELPDLRLLAFDFGMFLSLLVFFALTTCFKCPPFCNRFAENNENVPFIYAMAELQLEIQSRIYAADWSSLERIAKFFKADIEGKTRLAVAKHVVQRLEEEIGKLGDTEIVPYLGDLKQLLMEQPSVGKKGKGKSGKPVISDVKPPQEDSVQKLLATSTLR